MESPVNVCLFTLLKMMIIKKRRRYHSEILTDDDYAQIAHHISGKRKSKGEYLKKIFREKDTTKLTYSVTTLNALVSYLKGFGYTYFNDFRDENSNYDIVKKYSIKSPKTLGEAFFNKQDEKDKVYEWARNRCDELFEQLEKSSGVKEEIRGKEIFTKEEQIKNAIELWSDWAKIYPERHTAHSFICDTQKNNPELSISEIYDLADAYQKHCISSVFYFFETIITAINSSYIDVDTFLKGVNNHFDGFYRDIFLVFFPVKESKGKWAKRSDVIINLLEILPFEKVKSPYSEKPDPPPPASHNQSYTLVDTLVADFFKMLNQRTAAHAILKEMATNEPEYCLSFVKQNVSAEQFKAVREVINYYELVSHYYRNNRLSIPYLCNNDPVRIKYWYNTHLKMLFQNETNPEWNNLKESIRKLAELIPTIDSLNASQSLFDFSPDIKPQTTFKRKEVLVALKRLNGFLEFSWELPDTYYKMKAHSKAVWDVLSQAKHAGINNREVFFLRKKFASFLYMTGNQDEALELRSCNLKLMPVLFHEGSKEYKEEMRLFLHQTSGWQNLNKNEVNFCKETWGEISIQSFKAMNCRACLLIKFELFEEAKAVMKESERIKEHPDFDINELQKRNYHIDTQYGKIYYFEAKSYQRKDVTKMRSVLEIAIGHFNKAYTNYFSAHPEHISKNYVDYYLYECYKLLGLTKEMKIHYDGFSKFFLYHPVSSMCQVDSEQLKAAIKKGA